MKRTLSTAGFAGMGVLAAVVLYVVCVVAVSLLGGLFYSMTLGAMLAAVVALLIGFYLWTRRRRNTSGPLVVAMLGAQVVIAGLAIHDSPSTALMLFR
ncbi:hypothetical protein D8S82_02840 [Mycobacterium hodleri]|uniref:Uncharacterized protein n=1 Tax=Mycolicibacterium hodleri TaxID=49897 RepID=A0A544W701_9MYCO|nr:hypothetical protein [Mycolicibacterium hodleri]TQR88020.1 hypothetical protein D8S82_02840 [Mycolicibacterium hodleri]